MKDYIENLEDLKNYPIDSIAPGHGHLIENPMELIEHTIAHRLKREGKVINALKTSGGGKPEELVPFAYDDTPKHLHGWAKHSLLAHLYKLEAEKQASESEGYWKLLG